MNSKINHVIAVLQAMGESELADELLEGVAQVRDWGAGERPAGDVHQTSEKWKESLRTYTRLTRENQTLHKMHRDGASLVEMLDALAKELLLMRVMTPTPGTFFAGVSTRTFSFKEAMAMGFEINGDGLILESCDPEKLTEKDIPHVGGEMKKFFLLRNGRVYRLSMGDRATCDDHIFIHVWEGRLNRGEGIWAYVDAAPDPTCALNSLKGFARLADEAGMVKKPELADVQA